MDGLTARRTALQSEYRKAQREEREYDTLRQNVEVLLEKPREAEPQRQRKSRTGIGRIVRFAGLFKGPWARSDFICIMGGRNGGAANDENRGR